MKRSPHISRQQAVTFIALIVIAALLIPYLGLLADHSDEFRPWAREQRLRREATPSLEREATARDNAPRAPSVRAAESHSGSDSRSRESSGLDEIEALLAR